MVYRWVIFNTKILNPIVKVVQGSGSFNWAEEQRNMVGTVRQ